MSRVVVLGASPKEERYSNLAVKKLLEHDHEVVPIHPLAESIHGVACVKQLADVAPNPDTLTLYVGPKRLDEMQDDILALKPTRIIMNPGADSDRLEQAAKDSGIDVLRACTLVLLDTNQF